MTIPGKKEMANKVNNVTLINLYFSVQILAEEAHALDAFDKAAAQAALQEANSAMSSAADEAAKAEAQIAVETAEALLKALE